MEQVVRLGARRESVGERAWKHPHTRRVDGIVAQEPTPCEPADRSDQAGALCGPAARSADRIPRFDAVKLKPEGDAEESCNASTERRQIEVSAEHDVVRALGDRGMQCRADVA